MKKTITITLDGNEAQNSVIIKHLEGLLNKSGFETVPYFDKHGKSLSQSAAIDLLNELIVVKFQHAEQHLRCQSCNEVMSRECCNCQNIML